MTAARRSQILRMIPVLFLVCLLTFPAQAHYSGGNGTADDPYRIATAVEQIDQSNLPEWDGGWTHVGPAADGRATMWQTFTPAYPNLTAVEIDILTISPGQGDDVLTVEIAQDGAVLASVERAVEDGFNGLLRFEFPEAAPLVPEQLYELKVRDTGKTRFGWRYGTNTYERGSRYVLAEQKLGDWFFRTYAAADPPAAKYSGGTGDPNDPYQIATAADLIALGEDPNDYDKHFILTADIDLDPNLPGRKVFDRAVIAPDVNDADARFEGTPFTGVFDGDGHVISNVTIRGEHYLGLFGQLRHLPWSGDGEVRNLGVVAVDIVGSGEYVGGLVGWNYGGSINTCYCTGSVAGLAYVGGLAGANGANQWRSANVVRSHNSSSITGDGYVGGLVGDNWTGTITTSYNSGPVSGDSRVGGLVGQILRGTIMRSYNSGPVSGDSYVGGLVGKYYNGTIAESYNSGVVMGGWPAGGLVGDSSAILSAITFSFWDTQTSRQNWSAGGTGKTTAQMQDIQTYLDAGWDFVGETANGLHDFWQMPEDGGYPVLAAPLELEGAGTAEDPYRISNPLELGAIVHYDSSAHYRLCDALDFSDIVLPAAPIPSFAGTFDGNNLTISHLSITGEGTLGLFRSLSSSAQIKDLGVLDVNIIGSGDYVGALVGSNNGTVTRCYGTGTIIGRMFVGGLVGANGMTTSFVGSFGTIAQCYSMAEVLGVDGVGGLVGVNQGEIVNCYTSGSVEWWNTTEARSTGMDRIGALVGINYFPFFVNYVAGSISKCYSTSDVSPTVVGRCYLVGENGRGTVTHSFWETTDLRQDWPFDSGLNLRKAEMQDIQTYLNAGWDFVGETENGTEDIWWMVDGKDYPRLWWEPRPSYAYTPEPRNGTASVVQPVVLTWHAGASAAFHDVYLGEDQDVVSQAAWAESNAYRCRLPAETTSYDPGGLAYGRTYYWRIDEVNETDPNMVTIGDVWSFTTASSITYLGPANGATVSGTVLVLTWSPPPGEQYEYDVYLGTNEEAVIAATHQSEGIYRCRLPSWVTHYQPTDLQIETTYYWRIDAITINGMEAVQRGSVWSFTLPVGRHR